MSLQYDPVTGRLYEFQFTPSSDNCAAPVVPFFSAQNTPKSGDHVIAKPDAPATEFHVIPSVDVTQVIFPLFPIAQNIPKSGDQQISRQLDESGNERLVQFTPS